MLYQWYPGHMSKAKKQMIEDMKLIDVVIEILDARIPYSSKNPDIDNIALNKSRVIVLNKADIADKTITSKWQKYYEDKGYFVTIVNSKTGEGIKKITETVKKACNEKIERDRKKGILNRPIRAMIVGIPNVGKSTFINSYAGKSCAKTGNKPGVTKGKQWIRLSKEIELLDTPGILWPKFEDQSVGLKIAMIGSINEDILQPGELANALLKYTMKNYPGMIKTKYNVEECPDDVHETLNRIALKRGCLLKGGIVDTERTAILINDDFRNAKIGCISLEVPNNEIDK